MTSAGVKTIPELSRLCQTRPLATKAMNSTHLGSSPPPLLCWLIPDMKPNHWVHLCLHMRDLFHVSYTGRGEGKQQLSMSCNVWPLPLTLESIALLRLVYIPAAQVGTIAPSRPAPNLGGSSVTGWGLGRGGPAATWAARGTS